MVAKRFMFASAGVLMLVAAFEIGARMAGAQNVITYQETATLSGEVGDGGTIPLPHYRDGTEALDGECQWIVSPKVTAGNPNLSSSSPAYQRCSTTGRTVKVYWCMGGCQSGYDCDPPQAGCSPTKIAGTANYLIIAARSSTPTPTQKMSWGKVKASYR